MKQEKFIIFEKAIEDHDYYRIKALFNKDNLTFIDLSKILYEGNSVSKKSNNISEKYIIPENYYELISFIEKNSNNELLVFMHISRKNFKLIKKLSKFSYSIFFLNNYPDTRSFFRQYLSFCYHQLLYFLFNINYPQKVYFTGRKVSYYQLFPRSSKTKYLYFYSSDYLKFKKDKNKNIYKKKYFVFIDDMYPIHSDLEGKKIIDRKYYYDEINKFLKRVSNDYNIKCIVCAHPRSHKGYEKNFCFDVFFNKTSTLIKYSEFVLGHSSTAYSFGLFSYKPIVVTMFKSQLNIYYGKLAKAMSTEMNVNFHIIDGNKNFFIKEVDKESYKKYMNNYHLKTIIDEN